MRLHELTSPPGSRRASRRVGRGIASGQGKTGGRGQKGQGSRSSMNLPTAFEGGQMPLSQRVPKLRGFHNRFRKEYAVVNVGKLNRYEAGSTVDLAALRASGLVSGRPAGVKVLGAGELRVAVDLHVHRVSAKARAAIERAGGSITLLEAVATAETAGPDAAADADADADGTGGEPAAGGEGGAAGAAGSDGPTG